VTIDLQSPHLHDPIIRHARKDIPYLRRDMTIGEALATIRYHGTGEGIIYFYVVDEEGRLVGVLPTRRLLTTDLDKRLTDIMISSTIAIPHRATVLDACKFFVMHKLLAFPVVDDQRHIVGIIDIQLFTEEVFDLSEREQSDAVFETLGFRLSQVRDASPVVMVRFRFPWILATIGSGIAAALIASAFELTLAKSLAIAFFLTLMLGLGESVSVQSMTMTIQALRFTQPTFRWYVRQIKREATTGLLLGCTSGLTVALIIWLWRGLEISIVIVGLSIALALVSASIFGLTVPTVLHALRLDPKIAAGPITLAITDISTLIFYFSIAAVLL